MIKPAREFTGMLLSCELWVIGGLVALSLLDARALPLVIVSGLGFWLLRWLNCGRLSLPTHVDWPVAALVLMGLVTVLITAFPALTNPQVYRLLSGVVLFYALVNWVVMPGRLRWVIRAITLAGLLLALYATISVEWFAAKLPFIPAVLYSQFHVLVTDTVNPNVLAGSLVILLPVPLAVVLFSGRYFRRAEQVLTCLAVLVMTGMLVLSQSRGAWLSALLILMVLIALRWRWGWLAGVGLAMGGIVAAYLLGFQRLLELVNAPLLSESFEKRLELWSRAIAIIQDFPITGIGMGSFGAAGDILYPFIHSLPEINTHAHNLFLQIAVDLGLPGLLAWSIILVWVVILSWRIYRYGHAHGIGWVAGLGAGLLCSQLALMLHGLTDAVTWGMTRTPAFVWLIWGLTIACAKLVERSQPAIRAPKPAPGSDYQGKQEVTNRV